MTAESREELPFSLAGRRILITGAGSGIGRTLARQCLAQGAQVVGCDRDLDAVREACGEPGGTALEVDVASVESIGRCISSARAAVGPLDGLAACAGVSPKAPVLSVTAAAWDETLAVNLRGSFFCAQAMAAQAPAGSSLVLISSTAALGHVRGLSADYHASKAGVAGLTRYLAVELAPRRIRVNAVAPGIIRTPMTGQLRGEIGEEALAARIPLNRIGEPEDVSNAIQFLLSDSAALISGTVLGIDGALLAIASPGAG